MCVLYEISVIGFSCDDCMLGILQPDLPLTGSDLPSRLTPSHSVQYPLVPERRFKSPAKTPELNGSSLVDSGCFKSPSYEIPSVSTMDEFDALLLQLKCLGNVDLARPPDVQDQHTVPYFPPVTSALRKEHGMFNYRQSSCVEYVDDEALPSPQYLQMSGSGRDCVGSLTDIYSPLAAELQPFQTLSKSFIKQFCSQSCPNVSDQSAASAANNVEPWISPDGICFNGLNSYYMI